MGERRGSKVSDRQLLRAMAEGRILNIKIAACSDVKGYLGGLDDFHYLIVTPNAQLVLVHKAAAAVIFISNEPTYGKEPYWNELEKIISPFRTWAIESQQLPSHLSAAESGTPRV